MHSRFIWLRPIVDKTAATVAKELLLIIRDFGPARIIHSDNGPEFSNELAQAISDLIGHQLRFISPYNPRANGLAERSVQSFIQIVKKDIQGDTTAWPQTIVSTQLALNNRVSPTHGSTPFSVMFGRKVNTFSDHRDTEAAPPTSPNAVFQAIDRAVNIVFPLIAERSKLAAQKRQKTHDAKHRTSEEPFPIGSKVMILNENVKNNLEQVKEGPYTVASRHRNAYHLLDATNTLLPRPLPPGKMQLTGTNAPYGNSHTIQAILSHKGKGTTRKYLVRWKGSKPSDDSWEPYTMFDDDTAIQTYFKRRGLSNDNPSTPNAAVTNVDTTTHKQTKSTVTTTVKTTTDRSTLDPLSLLSPGETFATTAPVLNGRLKGTPVVVRWTDGPWERGRVTKHFPGSAKPANYELSFNRNTSKGGKSSKYDFALVATDHCTPEPNSRSGAWSTILYAKPK